MAIFGTNTDGGSTSPANANRMLVAKYALPVGGTVTAVNAIYATDSGAENSKAVIYADSAGSPGALLASSASVAAASGDVAHSLSVHLAAGTYWIGTVVDSFQYGWRFAASGGNYAFSDPNSFASPSNPFGAPSSTGTSLISVYATYTADAVDAGAPLSVNIIRSIQ